jgi:4-hydroxy-3-methylbut-2-enyl diphosphate reductase
VTGLLAAPLRTETAALRIGLARGGRPDVVVRRVGSGPFPFGAAACLGAGPVLVAGVCGALVPELRPGDVIVPAEVRCPDGTTRRVAGSPFLASALRRAGYRVFTGPLLQSETLVKGRAAREARAATGAIAVDMESGQLLAAAHSAPAAVVRVVVDTPDAPLVHPGTVTRGFAAMRTLASIAPILAHYLDACGPRRVLLASPRSFCAGVERAIATVERLLDEPDRPSGPVYVRRQIVHNAHVVAALEKRGAVFVQELDEVAEGSTVVLSAHGVTPAVRAEAAGRDLRVIDATCPLVAKVHTEAKRAAERGDTVVLIGHADHEEVEGTVGEAPERTVVVSTVADVEALGVADAEQVSYLMQTTLSVDDAREVENALLARFPSARGPATEDICYATSNRQNAVSKVAIEADVVLVVGSGNSSNSRRLVEVAERAGVPAYLVEDVTAVELDWLVGAAVVGVTAGASAPPGLVEELVTALSGLGVVQREDVAAAREDVVFELPREVRNL